MRFGGFRQKVHKNNFVTFLFSSVYQLFVTSRICRSTRKSKFLAIQKSAQNMFRDTFLETAS